jgi:hypothetical protein
MACFVYRQIDRRPILVPSSGIQTPAKSGRGAIFEDALSKSTAENFVEIVADAQRCFQYLGAAAVSSVLFSLKPGTQNTRPQPRSSVPRTD